MPTKLRVAFSYYVLSVYMHAMKCSQLQHKSSTAYTELDSMGTFFYAESYCNAHMLNLEADISKISSANVLCLRFYCMYV